MAKRGWFRIDVLFSLALVLPNIFAQMERECSKGLITPGYTEPHGDILIEYGNPLEIICVLHDKYIQEHTENSSKNLYFVRDNEIIPSEMIQILNSTSIRLRIEKPPKSSSVYTCKLKNDTNAVCLNNVIVGTKPQAVDDFECISYNFENLTCSWTPPENYAKTIYNLTYYFPGRASRYLRHVCPKMVPFPRNPKKLSCLWTVNSEPPYRQAQRTFYFELNMTNHFGSTQLPKIFSHFQHVLSGPPENLTLINTTSESFYLRWSVPVSMQAFPPGLQHRIMYQSEFEKEWKFGGFLTTLSDERKHVYFNLTNLKFAHALYDIRVSMRSNAAEPDDESMWSKNSSITRRTMSKVPGAAPATNIGSFEIVSSGNTLNHREVYIYWQQISAEITNGKDFTYVVEVEESHNLLEQVEMTDAYAKFKNLNIDRSYTFNIWSQNSVGRSINKSTVIVPKQSERIGEPLTFTKIAFGDGKYELSWEAPKQNLLYSSHIKNYTIFWCTHDRDRPYQCTGYLDWIEISNNKTVHNITVSDDKIHQFAISANSETSSSGMVWAMCTVIHNKAIGKMKNVKINHVYSTIIEVSWKLDCSDRIGSVEGFVIYYCSIVKPSVANCKGPEQNITINDPTVEQANITGLKPYETYMLAVAVISKHTSQSPKSDYLYKTTLEAAPSPPYDLEVLNISNSSITISWNKPKMTNGKLKYYHITYNNVTVRVEAEREEYSITNLLSYVNYNISVIACTVSCSEPSASQIVKTKGGYPGKTSQPGVTFQNDSFILVEWEGPLYPSGNNDMFEVNFKEKLQYENKSNPIINVTGTHYAIENCDADGKYNTFYISVRAVNIFDGQRYEGPWSDELESFCRATPNILIWIIISISLFVIVPLFYLAKKLYFRCQEMRDVGVKLPSGLAPVVISDNGLTHWDQKIEDEENQRPSADEELLLVKMSDTRNLNGDSSGCSSAHDSVTSSLELATHLSNTSDSGTEHPHSSSTEELHKNSLRLRNVASRPVITKGYVTMPTENINSTAWNTKSNAPGNYCVLGVDPVPITTINPSYVPSVIPQPESTKLPCASPSSPTQTSSYVAAGDFNKPSSSGYVPLNTTEAIETNADYVVTSNKGSDLLRHDAVKPVQLEEKPLYVQVSDPSNNLKKASTDSFAWHQPVLNAAPTKTGYVTIGDVPPPRACSDPAKGYIPHRHFDVKTIKED